MLRIDKIKPASGSQKKRKRVGRGNSSGKGTYSTRGLKGQKSRSGASNLKYVGVKKQLRAVPKLRGFKSFKPKNQPLNINVINKYFKDNDIIDPKTLLKKGLIESLSKPVKILGQGELAARNLKVEGVKLSESAKEKLLKNKAQLKGI